MSSDEEQAFDEKYGFWGEDGVWYDRRDNQHTKHDHIYGIFANNSSSNTYHKKHHRKKQPHIDHESYSSSLNFNFVKGEVQTVKESLSNKPQQEEHDPQHILKEWESVRKQKRDLNNIRNGIQLGNNGLPQRLGKSFENKQNKTSIHDGIGVNKDKGFAKWTKNEKRDKFGGLSFAERYLKKYAFKGRLGAESQGIANPIKQPKQRKYNEGLGFNGMDQHQNQPKNIEQELNEIKIKTINEKNRIAETQKMWKIIDEYNEYKPQMKKRKINYTTATHYYQNKKVEQPIVDYTRPNINICPAFTYNIERICDLIDERKEILHREKECLKQKKHTLKLQLDSLTKERFMNRRRNKELYGLRGLMDKLSNKEISMDEMYDVFDEIQNKFCAEYIKYRLWRLFESVVFPKIKEEDDIHRLIGILMKWRGLLSCNNNKKDVYHLLIEDVIIDKIRKEMYEWNPLEIEVNHRFVELFKKLKNVLPIKYYKRLLNNLIIPRLNHIFEENDIHNDMMRECIIKWDFVFNHDIDDILKKNITKKMKSFWKRFEGKNIEQHKLCIETLKHWETVLINMNIYNYIIESFILKKLKAILSECLSNIMMGNKTECINGFNAVHLWFLNDIFNVNEYIKLLQNGFFSDWLFLIYKELNNLNDSVDDIQFIWNDLFAVIKNDLFKTEHDKIKDLIENQVIEKYLNHGLDMIHFVVLNSEKQILPSFNLIEIRDKKREKKKNKNKLKKEWIDEYKREMPLNINRNESISILELIEITAENHGIEFCLCLNEKHDGKKVYKFGKSSICFYDKSIFRKQQNEWSPVDIQDLLNNSTII